MGQPHAPHDPPSVLALLGHPVAHSISPEMHEAAFAATGRRARYVACDVPAERLGAAVAGMAALGFVGCNCTVPLKEAACVLATRRSPAAAATGAANTLAFRPGGEVYADTTDGRGLLAALREQRGWSPEGRSVVLLGAGGAARSIAASLGDGGAARVTVVNRTPARAKRLVADLGGGMRALSLADGHALGGALAGADLLVQCTTVGMDGRSLPLPADALGRLPTSALVCDIVYTPDEETPLLAAARRGGRATLGGIGMLAWQAALSWEAWFGQTGPAAVFAAAARAALARRREGA